MLKLGRSIKIGSSEWTAASVEFTKRIVKREGVPDREVEFAILKLSDGKDEVLLEEGAPPVYNTYDVTFVCPKQAAGAEILVRQKQDFDFDGEKYTVVSIAPDLVTIRRLSDRKEIKVPKQ
jgi:hypothetical protein